MSSSNESRPRIILSQLDSVLMEGAECTHRNLGWPKEMICHGDGVIVPVAYPSSDQKLWYLETVIPGLSIDNTYQLYYFKGREKTLIGEIVRKHIYCRVSRTLIFSTYEGELFAYTEKTAAPQRLACGCEKFIASPDGGVILYLSRNKMWLRMPDGEERLVKSRCRDVILRSVSNDASLLVWGTDNSNGHLVTCDFRQDGRRRCHSFQFVRIPPILSNRTGSELLFYDNWNYKDYSFLFSYSHEYGFRQTLQLYEIRGVSGHDTLQWNSPVHMFDTGSLEGIILTYYPHSEGGYENDTCTVAMYHNGRFQYIAPYQFQPYFYAANGKNYLLGTYECSGGIIFWAELEDGFPVKSWFVSPEDQYAEVGRISLQSRKNPAVMVMPGSGEAHPRLYPLTVLETGMQHLLDIHSRSSRYPVPYPVPFCDWMEWLCAQEPCTVLRTTPIGAWDPYNAMPRYEEGNYICYLLEDPISSHDSGYCLQHLAVHSLCGKETLHFRRVVDGVIHTRWIDGSFYFFSLHTPMPKNDFGSRDLDLWYFDAERWEAIRCLEFVSRWPVVEPHRWEHGVRGLVAAFGADLRT